MAELLDPDHGLFNLSDDGFSLVPNPESATAAGADHLAQFALLGRILGLSFLHQEPVAAASRLNTALVRLLLGVDVAEIDMCQVSKGATVRSGRVHFCEPLSDLQCYKRNPLTCYNLFMNSTCIEEALARSVFASLTHLPSLSGAFVMPAMGVLWQSR